MRLAATFATLLCVTPSFIGAQTSTIDQDGSISVTNGVQSITIDDGQVTITDGHGTVSANLASLSATSCPSFRSSALYTSPIPPFPSSDTMR